MRVSVCADDDTTRSRGRSRVDDLARALIDQSPDRPVRLVYGVATAANTVAVRGADTAIELPAIIPVASGDYCAVLESGADRLIVGPVGRGYVSGAETETTDGSGDVVVTHGLGVTPVSVVATARASSAVCRLQAKTSTTFTIRFLNSSFAAIATTSVGFDWVAFA